MKNYRIYILALLLIIASQYLLAIDGWWEKIETKNKPRHRIIPAMDSFTENKAIMFGGDRSFEDTTFTLPIQNEFWIFDYEQKDWIRTEIKFPFNYSEPKDGNDYYRLGQMVRLHEGKMLVSFSEKFNKDVNKDSSLWTFDVESQKWERIQQTNPGPERTDPNQKMYFIRVSDDFVLGTMIYAYSSICYLYVHEFKDWLSVPVSYKWEETTTQISEGKVLFVQNKDAKDYKPHDPTNPNSAPYCKYRYFNIENLSNNNIYKGNEGIALDVNNKYQYIFTQNAFNIEKGKIMFLQSALDKGTNFRKYSHLFDFSKLDSPIRIAVIDTNQMPGINLRDYSTCKISNNKVLLYGGNFDSLNLGVKSNETWVFHTDPSLSSVAYAVIDNKNKNQKLLVQNSFNIETLNESIQYHQLTDLLGNKINNYTIEESLLTTKVTLSVTNGTYYFNFKLSNGNIYTFLLLVTN